MMAGEIVHPKATNRLVKTTEANRVRRATLVINGWDEDMGGQTSPTGRKEEYQKAAASGAKSQKASD